MRVFLKNLLFLLIVSTSLRVQAQAIQNELLTPAEWQRLDKSTEIALRWLASQQQSDGSFPTLPTGQPGVTSLCVMAFVTHGHTPGAGEYGEQLQSALDYIISCQKPNGIITFVGPFDEKLSRDVQPNIGWPAVYNHAISGLLLSEVFSMGGGDLQESQKAIEMALQATIKMQSWTRRRAVDQGGWRYMNVHWDRFDADLSVTGWQLMFLRSAKNAGFDVPQEPIDNAVEYLGRCFNTRFKTFNLTSDQTDRRTRGMAGAGILALAHAGQHESQQARQTGDWLLREGFAKYNESRFYGGKSWTDDRYHYGVFYACQAMYQLGGDYWKKFYPPTIQVVLDSQDPTGCWAVDSHRIDRTFGNAYTTALMALTLGAPNQLVPIFQR